MGENLESSCGRASLTGRTYKRVGRRCLALSEILEPARTGLNLRQKEDRGCLEGHWTKISKENRDHQNSDDNGRGGFFNSKSFNERVRDLQSYKKRPPAKHGAAINAWSEERSGIPENRKSSGSKVERSKQAKHIKQDRGQITMKGGSWRVGALG